MRKFNSIVKEKQQIAESLLERKVLSEFKALYSALLEHYGTNDFKTLDSETQDAFLRELNEYWSEDEGLNKNGKNFLKHRSILLTESSTPFQKYLYLKRKAKAVVAEAFKAENLKGQIYDILNEMFESVNAKEIHDVLSPDAIGGTIIESFGSALEDLMSEIVYEITPDEELVLNERKFSTQDRKKYAQKGYALPDGSYPIVSKEDLKNAIKSYGRAADKEKVKRHIVKRAKALHALNMLPDSWSLRENLYENKKNPRAHLRNRGTVVFPAESRSVKDDKDHFPINNEAQARNALARANQYSSAPPWYTGSLESLVRKVAGAVHKKYPGIKISKSATRPGRG